MNRPIRTSFSSLLLSSLVLLSACSSSDSSKKKSTDTAEKPLSSFLFVGETPSSGEEIWASDGTPEGTQLLKEINTLGHSSPANFIEAGSTVFFTADDGVHGRELWKKDANGTSMVTDLNSSGSTNFRNISVHNDTLYFITDSVSGSQGLWTSDGTAEGTEFISSKVPGYYSYQSYNTPAHLYFRYSSNLYRTDGSDEGTSRIPTSISSGERFNSPVDLAVVNNKLYFSAYTFDSTGAGIGYKLWVLDDTASEPSLIDIPHNIYSSQGKLAALNSSLVFYATDGTGYSLWMTDGTPAGTAQLKDTGGANVGMYSNASLYSAGNKVFFNRNYSYGQWVTDGTPAGTLEVNNSARYPEYIAAANGVAYFKNRYSSDNELWFTDGTLAGTMKVADFNVNYGTFKGTEFYFGSTDYTAKTSQLWKSSGTPASTVAVKSFVSNSEGSSVYNLYAASDAIYFSGFNLTTGFEPWVSDGTSTGTQLLSDLNVSSNASSSPRGYIELNNKAYFTAYSESTAYALWASDGTGNGTQMVKGGFDDINQLLSVGGKIFFVAYTREDGEELWVSDGTAEGTRIALDFYPGADSSNPYQVTPGPGGLVYFMIENILMVTDGTEKGTDIVSMEYAYNLAATEDKLFFIGRNGESGYELWVTEGTLGSTRMVKDINPTGNGVNTESDLIIVGNTVYFNGDDGTGSELWKSDGTAEGTHRVADLNGADNGLRSLYRHETAVLNNELYFYGYFQGERVIYRTDGTESGTVTVIDNTSPLYGYNVYGMYAYNNHIYFTADDATYGEELWKTDGTAVGTSLLKDINIDGDSNVYGLRAINGLLFFFAEDELHGQEVWRTDGTTEGTILLKDVAPDGSSGSYELEDMSSDGERGFCRKCEKS